MKKLFVQRSFLEKITFVFEWIRQNWIPLLKYLSIFSLPFCLVNAWCMKDYSTLVMNVETSYMDASIWIILGICYLSIFLGGLSITSVSFALFKLSLLQNRNLSELNFGQVWQAMKGTLGRVFSAYCVLFLLGVISCSIVISLAVYSLYTLFLTLPLWIASVTFLLPFLPHYVLGRGNLIQSISQAFKLGYHCWLGYVGTTLIMYILTNIIVTFATIPFYMTIFLQSIYMVATEGDSVFDMGVIEVLNYLSSLLMFYASMVTSILMFLMWSVQYGHSVNKVFGVSHDEEEEQLESQKNENPFNYEGDNNL